MKVCFGVSSHDAVSSTNHETKETKTTHNKTQVHSKMDESLETREYNEEQFLKLPHPLYDIAEQVKYKLRVSKTD